MNDFEKSMFIFFDEWGGSPHFSANHDELWFWGVDVDELVEQDVPNCTDDILLINKLYDLGWELAEDEQAFVSTRWGSC